MIRTAMMAERMHAGAGAARTDRLRCPVRPDPGIAGRSASRPRRGASDVAERPRPRERVRSNLLRGVNRLGGRGVRADDHEMRRRGWRCWRADACHAVRASDQRRRAVLLDGPGAWRGEVRRAGRGGAPPPWRSGAGRCMDPAEGPGVAAELDNGALVLCPLRGRAGEGLLVENQNLSLGGDIGWVPQIDLSRRVPLISMVLNDCQRWAGN